LCKTGIYKILTMDFCYPHLKYLNIIHNTIWMQYLILYNQVNHSLLPVYFTGSGCMTLHGINGLSSQMRSIRFVVTGTRKRPPASRSVCRGFQMLYFTRFGSAPTRDPGSKVLVNHFPCDGVLGRPVIRTQEAHNFTWCTCLLFININTYTIKWRVLSW